MPEISFSVMVIMPNKSNYCCVNVVVAAAVTQKERGRKRKERGGGNCYLRNVCSIVRSHE